MSNSVTIAASLIRLAISRTREYDADEDGSKLTGAPPALASALAQLGAGTAAPDNAGPAGVSHLMIANPFDMAGAQRMFSTHPPMPQRIERLRKQARNMGRQA